MRHPSLKAPAELEAPEVGAGRSLFAFSVRSLTPIYKGGANPKGIDEGLPFRGPTIRGVLRHWWRATQDITDVRLLREKEGLLFGQVFQGRASASQVRVGVSDMASTPSGTPDGLGYATWVTRNDGTKPFHDVASGHIRVTCPDEHAEDLRRALSAWMLAGGVGSRTRRGLGLLWTDDTRLVPDIQRPTDYAAALHALAPEPSNRSWPSLAGVRVLTHEGKHAQARSAVATALEAFHDVRSMRREGNRFSGQHRPPEFQDDWLAIKNNAGHMGGFTPMFGMPLAYRSSTGHFPGAMMISPKERDQDRLPSPVLVRAVRAGPRAYVAALILLQPWASPEFEGRNGRNGQRIRGRCDPRALDILASALMQQGWTLNGGTR